MSQCPEDTLLVRQYIPLMRTLLSFAAPISLTFSGLDLFRPRDRPLTEVFTSLKDRNRYRWMKINSDHDRDLDLGRYVDGGSPTYLLNYLTLE